MSNLKPCPYCGNTEPKTWWDHTLAEDDPANYEENWEGYNIKCCVVQIYSTHRKEAEEFWNQRWEEILCTKCDEKHNQIRLLQEENATIAEELEISCKNFTKIYDTKEAMSEKINILLTREAKEHEKYKYWRLKAIELMDNEARK